MEFKKYSEIENSYRTKFIHDIIDQGQGGGRWVVTNKIHGSNFQFSIDIAKGKVTCGKRTSSLHWEENFFGYQKVYAKYKEQLVDIIKAYKPLIDCKVSLGDFDSVDSPIKNITMILFGELFGGKYEHPEVARDNTATCVQREVQYAPHNDFALFDIFTIVEYEDGQVQSKWKPFDSLVDFANYRRLPVVPHYFVGTLDECLNYNNTFVDDVGKKLFGLPLIEGNICEGVVIRPWDETKYLRNGNRILIKNKNEKFAEKKGVKPPKPTKTPEDFAKEEAEGEIVAQFVNDARLRSVLSKIGQVTEKDFGVVQKALIEDVRSEFFKDYDPTEYGALFGKHCPKLCANLIRANFLNIVDGVY